MKAKYLNSYNELQIKDPQDKILSKNEKAKNVHKCIATTYNSKLKTILTQQKLRQKEYTKKNENKTYLLAILLKLAFGLNINHRQARKQKCKRIHLL